MVYRGRVEDSPRNGEGQVVVGGPDLVYKSHSQNYFNFAYSAFACFKIGMSGSASFQSRGIVMSNSSKSDSDSPSSSINGVRQGARRYQDR